MIMKTNAVTQDFLCGWILSCCNRLLRNIERPEEKTAILDQPRILPSKMKMKFKDHVDDLEIEWPDALYTKNMLKKKDFSKREVELIDPRKFITQIIPELQGTI